MRKTVPGGAAWPLLKAARRLWRTAPLLGSARPLLGTARLLLTAAWLLMVAALPAQTTGVMTRISATAKDALFLVDGQVFTGVAAFTWPAGSKHTLGIPTWQYGTSQKARYVFQHWSAPPGPLPSPSNYVTITADAGIPWYNADQTTEYAISLVFFQCAQAPCASPGTIWLDQAAFREDTDIWAEAGATVLIQAMPNDGFVFAGWAQGPAASLYTLVVNQPVTLYPTFAVARAIQLLTSPDGLQLLADRAPVSTPVTLEWGFDTTHSLAAVSPQWDRNGRLWLLKSWSDGGSASHNFQVPPGGSAGDGDSQVRSRGGGADRFRPRGPPPDGRRAGCGRAPAPVLGARGRPHRGGARAANRPGRRPMGSILRVRAPAPPG